MTVEQAARRVLAGVNGKMAISGKEARDSFMITIADKENPYEDCDGGVFLVHKKTGKVEHLHIPSDFDLYEKLNEGKELIQNPIV